MFPYGNMECSNTSTHSCPTTKKLEPLSYPVGMTRLELTLRANACDPEIPPLASSLHAGAHLHRHGAPRFGDAGAALVGLTVGGRTDSDFEALGKQRGWRDQNRKLQWLRAVTYGARALLACMAGTDAFRLRW